LGRRTGDDDSSEPGKILSGLLELGFGFSAVRTIARRVFTGNVAGNVAIILKKEFHVKSLFHIQPAEIRELQERQNASLFQDVRGGLAYQELAYNERPALTPMKQADYSIWEVSRIRRQDGDISPA
jgi:hypothetical protein